MGENKNGVHFLCDMGKYSTCPMDKVFALFIGRVLYFAISHSNVHRLHILSLPEQPNAKTSGKAKGSAICIILACFLSRHVEYPSNVASNRMLLSSRSRRLSTLLNLSRVSREETFLFFSNLKDRVWFKPDTCVWKIKWISFCTIFKLKTS